MASGKFDKEKEDSLIKQQKIIAAQSRAIKSLAKEWDDLLKKQKEGEKIDQKRLDFLEDELKSRESIAKKLKDNKKEIEDINEEIEEITDNVEDFETFIKNNVKSVAALNKEIISVGNSLGKSSKEYKALKNTQDDVESVASNIRDIIKSSPKATNELRIGAIKLADTYGSIQTEITKAENELKNGDITQQDFNKTIQKAKEEFLDLANSIDYSGQGSRKLKAEVESLIAPLEVMADAAESAAKEEMFMKSVGNADRLLDVVNSINNTLGVTSPLAQKIGTQMAGVEQAAESVALELAKWESGTGSMAPELERQKQKIAETTEAYKEMNVSVAKINQQYAQGKITQEQRISMIESEVDSFRNVASEIDRSIVKSEELNNLLDKMETNAKDFGNSVSKVKSNFSTLDGVMGNFSGIPAMQEVNQLIKTNIKDTVAWKAALFAVGAALGAAAGNYFGAPIKAAMQSDKERDQNRIDTEMNVAKIRSDATFIDQQIGQEKREAEIQGALQVARAMHEAGAAGIRAAHEFAQSMKSGAAQFQRAAKTALFGKGIGSVGYGAAQMQLAGVGADKVAEAMKSAGSVMGQMPTADMGATMALMAERTGVSTENIAQISEHFQRIDGMSAEMAINMQEGMRNMADKAGLNLSKFMEEVAEASKEALGYQIKSGPALAKQVAYAQSLGVSFGDIAKAGKSMVLNYKDSIKAEMQLSTLLGKQVDLSEVRAKFAEGDTAGAMEALKAQGLDPAQMDMFQQEALSQALGGMDLQSISKITKGKGKEVGELTAGNAKAGGQEFLDRTQKAESVLKSREAQISAESAVFDAKLSAAMETAFIGSDAYKKSKEAQAKLAEDAAKLAGSMQEQWVTSKEYKKFLEDSMKLDFVSGIKDTLFSGLTAGLGGLITMMGGSLLTGLGKSIMGGLAKSGLGKQVTGFFSKFMPGGGAASVTSTVAGAMPEVPTMPGAGAGGPSIGGDATASAGKNTGLLKKIFDTIKELLRGIKDTFLEVIKTLKQVGVELIKTIGSILNQAISTVGSIGGNLLTTATDLVGKFGGLLEKVAEIITNVGNKIASGGMKIFNTVVDGLKQASSSMPAILGNLGKAIGSFFQGMGSGLLAFAQMMATPTPLFGLPAGLIIVGMAMGIAQALSIAAPGIEALTPLLIGLAEVIGGTFVAILQEVGPIITAIFDGISKVIKTVGDSIATVMNAVGDSLAKIGSIDGGNLLAVAGALIPLSAGLVALGAGELINGILGFIGALFGGGESIWDKLIQLAQWGPGLKQAADAVGPLASAFVKLGDVDDGDNLGELMDNLKTSVVDTFTDDVIGLLYRLSPALVGVSNSLSTLGNIGAGNNLSALAVNLKSLIDSKALDNLNTYGPKIDVFSKALTGLNIALSGGAAASLYALGQTAPIMGQFGTALVTLATSINTAIATGAFTALANQTPILSSFAQAVTLVNTALAGGVVANLGMLSTMAAGLDMTSMAVMRLTESFSHLASIDLSSLRGIPWANMTNFGKVPGGSIVLAKSANNNFTIEKNSAKNIETSTKKLEQADTNVKELIRINKNLQALLDAMLSNNENSGQITLSIDGKQVTRVVKKRIADTQGTGGTTGGTGTGGGGGSDIRLKQNIELIGISESGINIYTFEYIEEVGIKGLFQGVIAQELIGTKYESALILDGEYYEVDYSKIDVDFILIG